jgi:hypothetical protein
MCYCRCPHENYSGECRYAHPPCQEEERIAEYEDRLEAYQDDLYSMMKEGEITAGQARAMYQRARATGAR